MGDINFDWGDGSGSDMGLSSDEEDFVSSQSIASAGPDNRINHLLAASSAPAFPAPPGELQAEGDINESADPSGTQTSLCGNGAAADMEPTVIVPRKSTNLLDLPPELLGDIIKEITHTHELTSLAMTCSALHDLTIPYMYSRFDIVWPETLNPHTDDFLGVDALSYGLTTLVMGMEVFQPIRRELTAIACSQCGCDDHGHQTNNQGPEINSTPQSRRGNNYARYIRSFSIGNGPPSFVHEYSVNNEVGKMLGTLVALAVARMVNLEEFTWDMPTGVVREIWLALASLANGKDRNCRLERIWVRWHDNSENYIRVRTGPNPASRLVQRYQHVEHPSLSVLPPLKSVAVLDIDEPAYVEELGFLIERSRPRLVELRIGIATHAYLATWSICASAEHTATSSMSEWPRVGGLLSIFTRRSLSPYQDGLSSSSSNPGSSAVLSSQSSVTTSQDGDTSGQQDATPATHDGMQPAASAQGPVASENPNSPVSPMSDSQTDDKLNLEVLELERVPLSTPNLLPTLDWTRLTTLTLMRCDEHESLWKALRRNYPPRVPTNGEGPWSSPKALEYALNLKHLRTDTVSSSFVCFIKDTLAPNTLESVYLHEVSPYDSTVPIEAIYRHILRRHRKSLRKVLVDASEQHMIDRGLASMRWKKWIFNHDMITFVTSGRMPQLRELGMAMKFDDWHHFLQRLPNMAQLRALYLPHIDYLVYHDLKELAMQVLDIVNIFPELKVTYVGLRTQCYQIRERKSESSDSESASDSPASQTGLESLPFNGVEGDEDQLGLDIDSDLSDSDADEKSRVHFSLREIVFYDDQVSIFKARHGVI